MYSYWRACTRARRCLRASLMRVDQRWADQSHFPFHIKTITHRNVDTMEMAGGKYYVTRISAYRMNIHTDPQRKI